MFFNGWENRVGGSFYIDVCLASVFDVRQTMSCSGTDAVSKSRPSRNASVSPVQTCSSMNLWKEKSPSITQILNSTSPVDNFTQGGNIFIGPLG